MDRDRARKMISGILNRPVDEVDTDDLVSMRHELEEQMRSAQTKGLYRKVIQALDTEIEARGEPIHLRPQTPMETRVAGGPDDTPGEDRHGVARHASMRWRVSGR